MSDLNNIGPQLDQVTIDDMNEEDLEAFIRNMRTQRATKAVIERTTTGKKKKPKPKLTVKQLMAMLGCTEEAALSLLAGTEEEE